MGWIYGLNNRHLIMLAIHHSPISFSTRWIRYCEANGIAYRLVNCYDSSIIQQLEDCGVLLWHHHHANEKDILFARQLLFALETAGKKVFPDFRTAWHFDDKIGQKYLLEAIGAPFVPAYVFYEQKAAMEWLRTASFPKVFKLRKGAGSINVHLVPSAADAEVLIRRAFSGGFRHTNLLPWQEVYLKVRKGKLPLTALVKRTIRKLAPTSFASVSGRESGYVYFQDFISGNTFDVRVVVVGSRAFAIKRRVRANDFRASGGGEIEYDPAGIPLEAVARSFAINQQLQSQCLALDFVFSNGEPLVVEISFGFLPEGYDACTGYWNENLQWQEGSFDPYGWMIDALLDQRS
jgi:glutathione synthase/RimK-type ligase-like ATP-grasp enzyme